MTAPMEAAVLRHTNQVAVISSAMYSSRSIPELHPQDKAHATENPKAMQCKKELQN